MIIAKKAVPRRTMLRGIGATLALPLLDGMVPALTALSKTAAKPIARFGTVYVPNGIIMAGWTPETEGAGFEFTPDAEAARGAPQAASGAERARQHRGHVAHRQPRGPRQAGPGPS